MLPSRTAVVDLLQHLHWYGHNMAPRQIVDVYPVPRPALACAGRHVRFWLGFRFWLG